MTRATCLTLLLALSCNQQPNGSSRTRSEAISGTSAEMSGPSLFSAGVLMPALQTLRAKADGKWLRVEIRPREIVLQAEDTSNPGAVLEYHYRDGKVGEAEQAALRGKGQLADNLFEMNEVKLDAIPSLAREALRRVDAEHGSVELVLVRRNLPESAEVRLRVYVSSPRGGGQVDADQTGQLL